MAVSAVRTSLLAVAIAAASTSPVLAQSAPWSVIAAAQISASSPAAVAEQHRRDNERLRLQARESAALARQQQAETRQRLAELQADRDRTASPTVSSRPFVDPLQTQARRDQADERRRLTQDGVNQIDSWLDRPQ